MQQKSQPSAVKQYRASTIFAFALQVIVCIAMYRLAFGNGTKDTGIRVVAYFTFFLSLIGILTTWLHHRKRAASSSSER